MGLTGTACSPMDARKAQLTLQVSDGHHLRLLRRYFEGDGPGFRVSSGFGA
jgi:hypothetical protein